MRFAWDIPGVCPRVSAKLPGSGTRQHGRHPGQGADCSTLPLVTPSRGYCLVAEGVSVRIKIGRKYQSGPQLSILLSNPSVRSSLEFQNVNYKYKTISALDLEQKLYRSSPIVPQCHTAARGSDNPQSPVCSQSAASVLQTSQHEFSY